MPQVYRPDMTASELVLLRRALKVYARVYQDLSHTPGKPQWERDEDKLYARRADELCIRLMKVRPVPTQEEKKEDSSRHQTREHWPARKGLLVVPDLPKKET